MQSFSITADISANMQALQLQPNVGIDDSNVRDWRFANGKLWLQTSDSRGDSPRNFNWSLDLSHVL